MLEFRSRQPLLVILVTGRKLLTFVTRSSSRLASASVFRTIAYAATPNFIGGNPSRSLRCDMSRTFSRTRDGSSPCITYASHQREISSFAASDSPPA
ncbi:MAG TPA: hypothetical protein VGD38_02615 [Pyrinomonadaceae bacterium]